MPAVGGSGQDRARVQSVRTRDRVEVGRAQDSPGRVPSRTLQKSDDRRRNGRKVSPDGTEAAVSGPRGRAAAPAVGSGEAAEDREPDRSDAGLIAADSLP